MLTGVYLLLIFTLTATFVFNKAVKFTAHEIEENEHIENCEGGKEYGI